MSNLRSLKISAVFVAGIALVVAAERGLGPNPEPVIKSRPTHEQLAKRQRPPSAESGKEVSRDDVLKLPHRVERQGEGLVSRSSIISSASNWTLLPKRAILHVPPLFEQRVNNARNGKLTTWQDFYGKNRGWIRELPVTIAQAKGEDPLSKEYLESVKAAGQVVVAVCRGGPISVRWPEEPNEELVAGPEDAPQEKPDEEGATDLNPEVADAPQETPEQRAARKERVTKDLIRRLRLRSN